jgi:hypothetical protein
VIHPAASPIYGRRNNVASTVLIVVTKLCLYTIAIRLARKMIGRMHNNAIDTILIVVPKMCLYTRRLPSG